MGIVSKLFKTLLNKKLTAVVILLLLTFELFKITKFELDFQNYPKHPKNFLSFNEEWEVIGNQILIRLKGIYYMVNDSLLIFNVIAKRESLKYMSIEITHIDKKVSISNDELEIIDLLEHYEKYHLYQIRARLTISFDKQMMLYFRYPRYTSKAIKISTKLKNGNSNSIFLCSRFYNNNLDYDQFRLWIQISKKLNYSKIVVYNNSILNNDKFTSLFKEHYNFIKLKTYFYLPYINPNTHVIEFYNYSNKHNYNGSFFKGILMTHERNVINECYLDNAYSTEFIAVMDPDEGLILNLNNLNCSSLDLYNEMKKLQMSLSTSKKSISYWFSYKIFLNKKYEQILIQTLNSSLYNQTKFSDELRIKTIELPDTHNPTEMIISDEKSFLYAKNLIEFYEKKLFVKKEPSSPFEFLITIQNQPKGPLGYGKSVHETRDIIAFGQHDAITAESRIDMDYKYGYIGHFRQITNFFPNKFKITNLQVDLSVYNCIWNKPK
jgi:hypothetical protein